MRKNEGDEIERAFHVTQAIQSCPRQRGGAVPRSAARASPIRSRNARSSARNSSRVFEEESKKLAGREIPGPGHDLSRRHRVRRGASSATIKSHHNVGGLPKDMRFEGVVEPLRGLFKDEVRALGRQSSACRAALSSGSRSPAPASACACWASSRQKRSAFTAGRRRHLPRGGHPAIRVRGRPVFRGADRHAARSASIGDVRTYDYTVALRAVTHARLHDVRIRADCSHSMCSAIASSRIVNEVKGAGRVVYDITSKPPATIEWE